MTLFKITNRLGDFWVVEEDCYKAECKLRNLLSEKNYGFPSDRIVKNIQIISSTGPFTQTQENLIL